MEFRPKGWWQQLLGVNPLTDCTSTEFDVAAAANSSKTFLNGMILYETICILQRDLCKASELAEDIEDLAF